MNVNNNMNNRSSVNFNGAIKIKADEAKVLLAKIASKWPEASKYYVNKTDGDVSNIYFASPRIEKYAVDSLKDCGINYSLRWDKPRLSPKEFGKFVGIKISDHAPEHTIVGAVKLPFGEEFNGLLNALKRRIPGGKINGNLFLSTPSRREVNIILNTHEFKASVLRYLQGSKTPDYILFDKPLVKKEFTEFACSQVYE